MDGYERLANAIILQAVKDYRYAKHSATRASIERFICYEWFKALTSIDGECLVDDPICQLLLEMRYVGGKTWEEVACAIGYNDRTVF
jgi:hypothetical protein